MTYCVALQGQSFFEIYQARKNHGSREWCSKLVKGSSLFVGLAVHFLLNHHHRIGYVNNAMICAMVKARGFLTCAPGVGDDGKPGKEDARTWTRRGTCSCFDDSFHVTRERERENLTQSMLLM